MNEQELIKNEKKKTQEEKKLEKLKQKQLDKQRARIHNELIAYEKKHAKEKKSAPKDCYISLKNINKIYSNHVQAVYDFNLDIKEHEFIVLVGPSGCGKSTTLRMVSGLEDITSGDLYISGTYANNLHPKDREIAMVFQSYALYPHMTVAGNMAFSLRIRKFPKLVVDNEGKPILGINKKAIKNLELFLKNQNEYKAENLDTLTKEQIDEIDNDIKEAKEKIEYLKVTPVEIYKDEKMPKEEIRERVLKAADILQINDYLDRKPKELSGGQCQRVALGRAIVRNAKVFLMDEPLSNLDAKLRVAMRSEIIKLHNSLNATTIYVTHDQTEAMTMASRIVVMNKGYVQQIDTPINIYNHPANMFVATFIGSPSMNLLECSYKDDGLTFKEGYFLKLNEQYRNKIKDYYDSIIGKNEEKLKALDASFVERNELLEKIETASKENKKEELESLQKQLDLCENANPIRTKLVENISKYKELLSTDSIDVIFGIRPEDIIKENFLQNDSEYSDKITLTVDVSELLGHEYFAHARFEGKEIIAKIQSKTLININDKLDVYFDMEKIHIFDQISQETII